MGPDYSDFRGSYPSQVNNWNKLNMQSGIRTQAGILQVPLLLDISGLRHIVFGPFLLSIVQLNPFLLQVYQRLCPVSSANSSTLLSSYGVVLIGALNSLFSCCVVYVTF